MASPPKRVNLPAPFNPLISVIDTAAHRKQITKNAPAGDSIPYLDVVSRHYQRRTRYARRRNPQPACGRSPIRERERGGGVESESGRAEGQTCGLHDQRRLPARLATVWRAQPNLPDAGRLRIPCGRNGV